MQAAILEKQADPYTAGLEAALTRLHLEPVALAIPRLKMGLMPHSLPAEMAASAAALQEWIPVQAEQEAAEDITAGAVEREANLLLAAEAEAERRGRWTFALSMEVLMPATLQVWETEVFRAEASVTMAVMV
jgi:hypothetical protein